MSSRRILLAVTMAALSFAAIGCGKNIGDSCEVDTDCASDGTRTCDLASPSGYCTILGCDYDTCPSDAVCVRFYVGGFTNQPCDPQTEGVTTHACDISELCALEGFCVPRSAEQRYCMATCGNNGDCRSDYECRDETLASKDGGEIVLGPGLRETESSPKFCAPAPETTN